MTDTDVLQGELDQGYPLPRGRFVTDRPLVVNVNNSHVRGDRTEIVNHTTDLFQLSDGASSLWSVTFSDLNLRAHAGKVFDQQGDVSLLRFERLDVAGYSNDHPLYDNGGYGHNACVWRDSKLSHPLSATVPAMRYVTGSSEINGNRWDNLVALWGGDYFWHLEQTAPGYINGNRFTDVLFEVNVNGCIRALSTSDTVIEDCSIYDLQIESPARAHLFHIGKGNGSNSRMPLLRRVRRHGGTLAAGVADVLIENGTGQGLIEACGGPTDSYTVDLGNTRTLCINPQGTMTWLRDSYKTVVAAI